MDYSATKLVNPGDINEEESFNNKLKNINNSKGKLRIVKSKYKLNKEFLKNSISSPYNRPISRHLTYNHIKNANLISFPNNTKNTYNSIDYSNTNCNTIFNFDNKHITNNITNQPISININNCIIPIQILN